ncbi:LysR substrate-binding domain-containing protein [Trinickia dinghuensis]|uniref:LysR family transcriptional regulator n=1 Tax=Trinickia dinghuensis TaxID=2291023 RepID=A0A3D8K1E0_9BURK|nr:LysR substrate-binding domain-containing protein [Trinickia dinghuensis]RDU98421.1 LysR family transcriptional regulator [Trinickia dinghuensis]
MKRLPVVRTLLSFEAVAEYSSFSSAAASIGMTHGAISHQMRTLEEWLGQPVFERHSGGVRLTRNGERLRQACKHAFSILEQECQQIRSDAATQALTIACSTTFLAQWLLPRIEGFAQEHPDLLLHFQTRTTVDALLAGKVDVLILSGHSSSPVEGADVTRLVTDRIGPVCSPSWPTPPTGLEQIRDVPLLHATSRLNAWSEWIDAVGLKLDLPGGTVFESLSLSIEAAKGGLGFAIAPEFLVRHEILNGTLIAPLGFSAVDRGTWIYTRSEEGQRSKSASFVDWLLGAGLELAPASR